MEGDSLRDLEHEMDGPWQRAPLRRLIWQVRAGSGKADEVDDPNIQAYRRGSSNFNRG